MTYFPRIDKTYTPSPIVLERTKDLARCPDYEHGYWMQMFMHVFRPVLYQKANATFGIIRNHMELRYLMEHAIFDPGHPLYGLDYETASEEDRKRLDVFCEIARQYGWMPFIRLNRPNFLPAGSRRPLSKDEEKYIRRMKAFYSVSGTPQEREAFLRHYKFGPILRPVFPTGEERAQFDEYVAKIFPPAQELHEIASDKVYLTAHEGIKSQMELLLGPAAKCKAIVHPFEEGDIAAKVRLPRAREIVMVLTHDVRSHLLLRYIAKRFKGRISVIHAEGVHSDSMPLAIVNPELEICSRYAVELNAEQRRQLGDDFERLNIPSAEYFRLRGYEICHLSYKKVRDHIISLLKNGALSGHELLGKAIGYAPRGWPMTDQFYFRCIGRLLDEGILILAEKRRCAYDSVVKLAQN